MGNFKLGRGTAVILAGIFAAIVIAFFYFVDVNLVVETVRGADLRYLLLASLFLLIGLVFFTLRWRLLMGDKPPFKVTFWASNLGLFFNMIIPARGGELLRIIMMGQKTAVTYAEATTSFAVERLIEQVLRLLFFLLAIFAGAGLALSTNMLVGTAVTFLAFVLLVVWSIRHREATLVIVPGVVGRLPFLQETAVRDSLAKTLDNLEIIAKPKQLLMVWIYSFLCWGAFTAFYYAILVAIGFPQDGRLPVVLASMALAPPSAPSHPGISQASIVVPLAALGFDSAALTAYGILAQLVEAFWMGTFALTAVFQSGLSFGQVLAPIDDGQGVGELQEQESD